MTSSNTTVVANSSVTWSGTYPNCSAVITPETGATGTPTITFTVTDSAGLNASSSFSFYVTSAFALGQSSVSDVDGYKYGLAGPQAIAQVGSNWLILNSTWSRINVYTSELVYGSHTPAFYIGQSNHLNNAANQGLAAPTASTLNAPKGMTISGTSLIVADSSNNRVLIWNTIPSSSNAPADVVLGQADFTGSSCNQGGSASSTTLCNPQVAKVIGTKLFVADKNNSRVLVWNSIPTTNNAPASLVIGQPDFTTISGAVSATKMNQPYDIDSDGTKLVIADAANNRVLIYNSIPTSNGTAADVAVGQANLTSSSSGTTSQTMYSPYNVTIANSKMYVSEGYNNRITVWNTIPTVNNAAASYVIGQTNMTATNWYYKQSSSAMTHSGQGKVAVINGKIYCPDSPVARILVFNNSISADSQAADYVIGQISLNSQIMAHHQGNQASFGNTSEKIIRINSTGTDLQIADTMNHRVLVWNLMPTNATQIQNFTLGQPDANSRIIGYQVQSASTLSIPHWSLKVGSKFVVVDYNSNRVLIWNSMPTSDGQAANVVIGEPDMASSSGGGTLANLLQYPQGAATDGTKLFIADTSNSRVLVWNTVPTTDYSSANFAVGQANLTTGTSGTTASTMNQPTNIQIVGTKLFVTDTGNNRILVWNTLPTASGSSANFALGQPDLTSGTANNGGISAATLSGPQGVFSDGTKIFVADTNNHRVLVWNSIPTTSGQPADAVIGQPDFVSNSFSYSNISHVNYYKPSSIYFTGTKLLIADQLKRVVFLNYP
jgi:uncharacterized protein (DUF736 family)